MPSGKTHTKLNIVSLPILLFLFVSYGMTNSTVLLAFAVGFLLGTYFLSPDLDTKSGPYRKWGLLRVFWYPYQKLMPHRSFLTHSFIIGDLIRLAYLVAIVSLVFSVIHKQWLDKLWFAADAHIPFLVIVIIGIMFASALHIAVDFLNTKRKRLLHRKRRRR